MPVAPFVPLISTGIGALFGAHGSKTPASATTEAQGQALQAQAGVAGQASNLSKYLQQQASYTTPALGRAMGYYDTLLRGNRAAMQQATAGAAGQISDTAKGAAMNLERMGVTGGQKVQAMADLARQSQGQLGQLSVGVQPGAAQALAGIGQTGLNTSAQALQGLSTAGNIYSSLIGGQRGLEQQQYGRQQQFGSMLGQMVGQGLNIASNMWSNRDGGDQRVTPYQMGF